MAAQDFRAIRRIGVAPGAKLLFLAGRLHGGNGNGQAKGFIGKGVGVRQCQSVAGIVKVRVAGLQLVHLVAAVKTDNTVALQRAAGT